jgi:capsular polysaccharide biosynthesis protein
MGGMSGDNDPHPAALTVTALEPALYLPGHYCLYDAEGWRIRESCLLREPGLPRIARHTEERVAVPGDADRYEGDVVYGGWMPPHWGHLLTEGIARLWFDRQRPDLAGLPILFTSGVPDIPPIEAVFDLAGLAARVISFERPTLVSRVFLPVATFRNRGLALPAHLALPHAVASRLRDRADPPWRTRPEPVYLSRTRLGQERSFLGEERLESHLAARGVRVVYPESLPFADQVRLVNEHAVFIGCWGSAFHSLVFRVSDAPAATHVICEPSINGNFALFDRLIGLDAHYVHATEVAPGQVAKPWATRVLHVAPVLEHLAQYGVG